MSEARMIPVLVGLDYQTAPLAVRERLQADDEHLLPLLASLRHGIIDELVVLSTCNRYEVFATSEDPDQAQDAIVDCLLSAHDVPTGPLLDSHYRREGRAAVRHLMRVAAGLESLVLGETQIMRQLTEALSHARETGTSGPILNRLFTAALHTGKRARTETAISQHTLSVSHAAVLLVEREMATVEQPRIVVVGAGEMATLAADALAQRRLGDITVINRNAWRAQELAAQLGIQARPWDELRQIIASADAVITATSARQAFLRMDDIITDIRERQERPLLLIDIGMPRNISPAEHAGATTRLYDIDDLQTVVAQHRMLREAEVDQVEGIINEEVLRYSHWLTSRRIVPVLTELRSHADAIAEAELERALNRLPGLDAHERDVMAQMAQRIVNKLLHTPTVTLKSRAAYGDHFDYNHAVRKLFNLDASRHSAGSDADDD